MGAINGMAPIKPAIRGEVSHQINLLKTEQTQGHYIVVK